MASHVADDGNDELLVGKIVDRDAAALESVYKRYGNLLYSVARRITDDSGTAEEILQDTFFQLWQSASLFDSARGSLIGWLLAMTRNRALSRLRKRDDRATSHATEAAALAHSIGSSNLEQEIARQLIVAALDGLPQPQRQAIALAYFEGLTCKEIAVRTKSPEGTIKSRLRSALRTMKHDLSQPKSATTERPRSESTELEDVLITTQLLTRICRSRGSSLESASLRTLSEVARNTPGKLIECFLQMGLDLCRAGTAGVSFLEEGDDGKGAFRWTHLAGRLEQYVGGTTPRNFSPCGVTLDCDSPQLFRRPARYFNYFNEVKVPIVEGLVIPFHANERTNGTVWIVSHDEGVPFDSEDARIMTSLTEFIQFTLPLVKSPDRTEITV
ncbi:MAG TPA: sigma-70 family RNA polymerase sigma factor [Terracidiphilus sp.]|jgi:RNA polymerase sigma factor (sigma-70 family)